MKAKVSTTVLALAAVALGGAAGCTSAYDSAYYDPYLYYSYYPADAYYSSYYWADPYYYSYQDYGTGAPGDIGGVPDAGTVAAGPVAPIDGGSGAGIGAVIRALARGEEVCPGHVTVTPKTDANPCPTSGAETVRGGATLVFDGCALTNGGMLNGTIDVTTTRTASEPTCSASTTITIEHTTTISNLSYMGPAGRRLLIPSQTAMGSTSFLNGQRPAAASAHVVGRLELVEQSGALGADRSYEGDITVTPSTDRSSYSIDGVLTLTDADQSGTVVLTATGLTRTADCCRPTAGRLSVVRTGNMPFTQHIWTFASGNCGGATFDDDPVTLAACL
jgi:hypothetical protein